MIGTVSRVVVVGAGPSGLTLACELALAGVPCRVLERHTRRAGEAWVVGIHSRTEETFRLRGYADQLAARGRRVAQILLGCGGSLDVAQGGRSYLNVLPQSATEEVLEARAGELGVEIIRSAEVTGLTQDETGVTVHVHNGAREWNERASYVVGCDGGDSRVRASLGVPFPGRLYELSGMQADVRLGRPLTDGVLLHLGIGGAMVSVAAGDSRHRLTCLDTTRPWNEQPLTLDELRATLHRLTGRDLEPRAPRFLSRLQVGERIVSRYRVGRVLLAGDAAHVHSPVVGLGINLAVEDAVNLGWKLAGVVNGWAPSWLLDTYESERRPAAENVVRVTGRATRAMVAPGAARRRQWHGLVRQMLAPKPGRPSARVSQAGGVAGRLARLGSPAWAGERVADVDLVCPDGSVVRLYELLYDGRLLLLDLGPDARCATLASHWAKRVRAVVADPVDPGQLAGVTAVLVRPDGHIAWATRAVTPSVQITLCREALRRWSGPADRVRTPRAVGVGVV